MLAGFSLRQSSKPRFLRKLLETFRLLFWFVVIIVPDYCCSACRCMPLQMLKQSLAQALFMYIDDSSATLPKDFSQEIRARALRDYNFDFGLQEVSLSVFLFGPSVFLSVCLSAKCKFMNLFQSVCHYICILTYLYLHICLPVCQSVSLSVCLSSLQLCACLSILTLVC